jgi:hypothetical protein
MQDQTNYRQINWIDGMKINKDHFIGLENHFTASDADIRRLWLDQYSYGLLPPLSPQEKNLDFEASIDDQGRLNVKLQKYRALTPDGFRIEISGGSSDNSGSIVEAAFNLSDHQDREFYIMISLNPFVRVPSGLPDSGENPLRQPFAVPECKLNLAPASVNINSVSGVDSMPFAKVSVINNRVDIDESYIPPCASINSHPELVRFYNAVNQNVISLEKNVIELIAEVNLKTTSNALINIVMHIADSLQHYLNSKVTEYKWFTASRPPVFLIANIVSIARTVKNAFDTRIPEEREKLLNYLSEHFDINPAKFRQLLDTTIGIEYQHNQINQSLNKAGEFINVFSLLINELKKMEFIVGEPRKKRIDIIIK